MLFLYNEYCLGRVHSLVMIPDAFFHLKNVSYQMNPHYMLLKRNVWARMISIGLRATLAESTESSELHNIHQYRVRGLKPRSSGVAFHSTIVIIFGAPSICGLSSSIFGCRGDLVWSSLQTQLAAQEENFSFFLLVSQAGFEATALPRITSEPTTRLL